MWISSFNLANFRPYGPLKNYFKYLNQMTRNQNQNLIRDARDVPKGSAKDAALPRSRITPQGSKRNLDNSSWKLVTVGGILAAVGCSPNFCMADLGGTTTWQLAAFKNWHLHAWQAESQILRTQIKDKQETDSYPWQNQGIAQNQILTRVTIQRTHLYKCFFPANLNLKRKRLLPPTLDWSPTGRDPRNWHGKNSSVAFFDRFRISNRSSCTKEGVPSQWCPVLGARYCNRKNFYSTLLGSLAQSEN